jgi:hypothetical protein
MLTSKITVAKLITLGRSIIHATALLSKITLLAFSQRSFLLTGCCWCDLGTHKWIMTSIARLFSTVVPFSVSLGTNYRNLDPDLYLFNSSNSMKMGSTREATSCAVTQELPKILWNPKVHCRADKGPSLVTILSQTNSVHTTPFYLSKIHLIHIL